MLLRSAGGLAYAKAAYEYSLQHPSLFSISTPGCYFFNDTTVMAYQSLDDQLDLKGGMPKFAQCDAQGLRRKAAP